MKQIITLTRMQLGSVLEFLNIKGRKARKKNLSAMTIVVLGFLLFGTLSGFYSFLLGESFKQIGQLHLLPGLMMAVNCVVIICTTFYKVKSTLFGFKDYDIVMSLPVKTWYVVASRVLLLYLIELFFTIAFIIPNMIAYGILAKPPVMFYIFTVIAVFFIPMVPMIIAAIIGTIIAAITSKFRYSNIINIILLLAVFSVIFVGSFMMNSQQQMIEMGSMLTNQMEKLYPLSALYLDAVINSDILAFVQFLLISIAVFAIFCILVGKSFKKLNTSLTTISARGNYKLTALSQSSPWKALLRKEAKRFFSSSLYVLNSGIGLLMLTIAAVVVGIIQPKQLTEMLSVVEIQNLVQGMAPFIICFIISTVYITACSISLEGKNFWILRSSPVLVKDIFKGKIMFSMMVLMPFIIVDGILIGIGLKLEPLSFLLTLLLPASFAYLFSVLGLFVNLKFPVMNWTNEAVIIKNSAASMISIFGNMIICAIPIGLYFLLDINALYLCMGTVFVTGGAGFTIQTYLYKNGDKLIGKIEA